MKEGASKKKLRMVFLIIAAVIVLAGVLLYIFVVKPSYSGYAVKLQTQGASQEDVRILYAILTQVNQTGYLPLSIPGTNQTVVLYSTGYILSNLPQLCSQYQSSINVSR